MPSYEKRPRPVRKGLVIEEEKTWISFYQRAGKDAAIAAEILAELESDPELKRLHLALFLHCKESLRLDRQRQLRNQRIGLFLRRLLGLLFARPLRGLQGAARNGGDIALAALTDEPEKPAQLPAPADGGPTRTARKPRKSAPPAQTPAPANEPKGDDGNVAP